MDYPERDRVTKRQRTTGKRIPPVAVLDGVKGKRENKVLVGRTSKPVKNVRKLSD